VKRVWGDEDCYVVHNNHYYLQKHHTHGGMAASQSIDFPSHFDLPRQSIDKLTYHVGSQGSPNSPAAHTTNCMWIRGTVATVPTVLLLSYPL
jgi:hypothetical protein